VLNDLETFTALFTQLKRRVKDNPVTLAWLSEQRDDIRRLAHIVEDTASRIRKSGARKRSKHTVVPSGFISAWRDYEHRFASPLKAIATAESAKEVEKYLAELRTVAAKRNQDLGSLLQEVMSEIEAHKQPGDSFDPTEDDPASLIEEIFLTFEDVVNSGLLSDSAADKAIGAWNFFDTALGLNHREIYSRWRKVPELLIPAHALSANSRPIIELYNEAVRAYVFGNKVASISMCRALLEHVLKEHYHIGEESLAKVIAKAEGVYPQLRRLKLQRKRELANRVMHDYENQTDMRDQSVIEFLKTLQAVVRDIPK
jgi:hypothetical protein